MATNKRAGLFDPSIIHRQMQEQGLVPPRTDSMLNTAYGAYYPEFNFLIAPSIDSRGTGLSKEDRRDVLSHESTHAWTSNVLQPITQLIQDKKEKTKQEENFLDAISKLSPALNYNYVYAGGEAQKDYINYVDKLVGDAPVASERRTPVEMPAYALGAMSAGPTPILDQGGVGKGGSHQDATITTDYSIIMDLIDQLPQDVKDQAALLRKNSLRNFDSSPQISRFSEGSKVDLANPFFTANELDNPLLK